LTRGDPAPAARFDSVANECAQHELAEPNLRRLSFAGDLQLSNALDDK
jgi:hypothetical protein